MQKVGEALSGYCNIVQKVWLHSCAWWLPMDFINSKVWQNVELHERVMPMDNEDFCAHSMGFYKRADRWMYRHPPLQSYTPVLQTTNVDMSRHVFIAGHTDFGRTTAKTSTIDATMAHRPTRPSLHRSVSHDQPPHGEFATSHFGASDRGPWEYAS